MLYSINRSSSGSDWGTACFTCSLIACCWRNFLSLAACTLRRWVSFFVLMVFALVRPPWLVRVDRRRGRRFLVSRLGRVRGWMVCEVLDSSFSWPMGVLARVLRWCTKRVARTVCLFVGSVDDDGRPTLGTALSPTLGAGRLVIIVVNCWRTVACFALIAALAGIVGWNSRTNSVAAMIVLSSSEMVGSLQWAG